MRFNSEFEKYAILDKGISSSTLHQYNKVNLASSIQARGYITPTIIEERPMNIAAMDVFSRLMLDRIIFLGTAIDDYVGNVVTAQLLFLESSDAKRDIQLYCASPGGSVSAGLSIVDTMQYITANVATMVTSMAASMGAVILAAGEPGMRSALKHARIMIHQPMSGIPGGSQASDMEIAVREVLKCKKELYDILAEATGQSYEKIEADADRDFWLDAEGAKSYGIIDEIVFRDRNSKDKPKEERSWIK